eukprot:IDg12326t1
MLNVLPGFRAYFLSKLMHNNAVPDSAVKYFKSACIALRCALTEFLPSGCRFRFCSWSCSSSARRFVLRGGSRS